MSTQAEEMLRRELVDAPRTRATWCRIPMILLPRLVLAFAILTFCTTFVLFYKLSSDEPDDQFHDGWRPRSSNFHVPTISRTGGEGGSAAVFTAGLHLMSFLYAVLVVAVHCSLRHLCASRGSQLAGCCGLGVARCNHCAMLVGLCCSCAMFFTGTFYLGLQHQAHSVFAACTFLSGNLYSALLTCGVLWPLHRCEPRVGPDLWWLYHQITWMITGCLSVVAYSFVLSMIQSSEHCDGDHWCGVRNVKSVIEYVLASSLIGFTVGLTDSVRHVSCSIHTGSLSSELCESGNGTDSVMLP